MDVMTESKTPKTNQDFGVLARDLLARELGERAPQTIGEITTFDENPLEGEGPSAVVAFELEAANPAACDPNYDPRHYAIVGHTTPNYYPAYSLSPNQAYSLHLGTRFLVQMQARGLDLEAEPADARDRMREFVRAATPGATLESEELATLFQVADQIFAVYRLTIDSQPVYFMGLDCPPGFYETVDLPAPVVLRLHLGQLIRREPELDDRDHGSQP
jgi:hypothetical protein